MTWVQQHTFSSSSELLQFSLQSPVSPYKCIQRPNSSFLVVGGEWDAIVYRGKGEIRLKKTGYIMNRILFTKNKANLL